MKFLKLLSVALITVPAGQAFASSSTMELLPNFKQASRIINSLHMDKPGQSRVFAVDGSEFTGVQALWLKGQMHTVEMAAMHGDRSQATRELQQIATILQQHGVMS